MAISDAEYAAWLASTRNKHPVILCEIKTPGRTLNISTAQYRTPTTLYRARLRDYEITLSFDLESADFSRPRYGKLEVENVDAKLDDIVDLDHGEVELLLGDTTWDRADFRTQFTGEIYEVEYDSQRITLELFDGQKKLDKLYPAASFDATPGRPGTKALQALAVGGMTNVDTASFTALDALFPYTVTPEYGEENNVLDVVDSILSGLPVDYGQKRDGIIYATQFHVPIGSSTHRRLRPNTEPTCTVHPPLGQMTVTYNDGTPDNNNIDRNYARPAIQDAYPNYRSYARSIWIRNPTQHAALADTVLLVEGTRRDLLKFNTNDITSGIDLMDEVPVVWDRYGFGSIRYGVVTNLIERFRGVNELTLLI